jgi:2-polyprenyl-3-methyl-5-hydroxy-6-metoxy-1,4-benzoquinol methylase
VTFELANRIGPAGRFVGMDIDDVQLELARREAAEQGLNHVEFRRSDINECELEPDFDLVYSRFVLTHLRDPSAALAKMRQALRPGGLLVIEDVDFGGHFSHPESAAFRNYVRLYSDVARRRGADPNIGRRLPELLTGAGFERVQMLIAQPAGTHGEVKLISPLTMEFIAEAILAEGLAERHEIDRIIAELYEFAGDPRTFMSLPRVVQTWGYRTT